MSFDNEEYSDNDDAFEEDMEALRRACLLTGTNQSGDATCTLSNVEDSDDDGEDSADDDIELVRNLQKRFCDYAELTDKLSLTPLWSVRPGDDDNDVEDDFEALRAIRRRFAAYNDGGVKENIEDSIKRIEQVGVTNEIALEKEASNNLFIKKNNNAEEGFPDCVDTNNIAIDNVEAFGDRVASDLVGACSDRVTSELVEWQNNGARNVPTLPLKTSGFSKSALAFVDAIKKNRSCQKAIRNKLMQVQARIEQIKTLKGRVKILKDFQSSCKTRTSRALAQKKDVRVQLISTAKKRSSLKLNDKKTPALCYGPLENPHVAIYQDMLLKFPTTVTRAKWSKKEIENLKKGVKQQFQEKLLQQSVDILNDTEDSSIEGSSLDMIVASIRDCEITPQNMRSFLPKINWEQLASMYVPSHSGMECQSRFLNCEDPLINCNPWTNVEDKNLLHIVQLKGPSNWIDIAISLGTNRTPFQCLARYQRSLNASIIRREWTKEEDIKLQEAVEEYGENNWQVAASFMEGRTGTQCSNRWMKSLHPTRKRVGKWTPEEDKSLKVAVAIFGPKNWCKIAEFVPGRMQAQCRERWANSLDPSLNRGSWTSEEDLLLEKAIQKHGYCWSKVAQCVPNRTDNQCMRRWACLNPEQVPMLRAAKKTKREAMISNFVDRESERPAIGPNDFLQLPAIGPPPRLKRTESVRKRRVRRNRKTNFSGDDTSEVLRIINGSEGEDGQEVGTSVTQVRRSSRRQKRKVFTEEDVDDDSKAIRDSVGRNSKLKLKSNNKKNLPIAKYENPDDLESTDSFIAVSPKRRNCKRPKLKDVACSPENHEAVEDDDMTLASFLGRSFGAKRLSHSAEPAETVSASAYVDSTALVDENASVVGISQPNRLITMEEMSSDQMQVDESVDDLPLSYFCTKLKDTVSASAKVDAFAQVDENASAAAVSLPKKTKKPRRLSIMEELSSDQMLVDDSWDDLPLSRFRKKLNHTRARVVEEADAETVSASAEVDSTVQVDENSSAAAVIQSKRLSTMEETSPDPMQIEESGDDLPLSRFCKKLKDTRARVVEEADAETVSPSAEVDSAVQVDENSSAAAVIQPKRLSTMEERSPDPMQIEESGDDLPLSRFCKKVVKDSHANTEDGQDNMTFTHFYKRLKRRKC